MQLIVQCFRTNVCTQQVEEGFFGSVELLIRGKDTKMVVGTSVVDEVR